MPFSRFVEIGRVVLVNYGPDAGKLAVIIDVIDQNRAFVECPATGVLRQQIPFNRLALTDIKLDIPRSPRSGTLAKMWAKGDVLSKWEKTSWAQKLARRTTRANLSDFERFKVMVLRKKRSAAVKKQVAKLRKTA
eukprot:GILI01000253.1.p2 GENE.GILI01000253.1~~GILI01000253.1.p2  ORF type:complete len:135 (+),score=41.95 GILI01000253.1:64-468(+)